MPKRPSIASCADCNRPNSPLARFFRRRVPHRGRLRGGALSIRMTICVWQFLCKQSEFSIQDFQDVQLFQVVQLGAMFFRWWQNCMQICISLKVSVPIAQSLGLWDDRQGIKVYCLRSIVFRILKELTTAISASGGLWVVDD
jgi:hypothetical protein